MTDERYLNKFEQLGVELKMTFHHIVYYVVSEKGKQCGCVFFLEIATAQGIQCANVILNIKNTISFSFNNKCHFL